MTTRTITLIRHAKSSWADPSLPDFERSLNKRGFTDAPKVGDALKEKGLNFDLILCSDANRARQTLSLLQQEAGFDEDIVEYRHDLYCASAEHLLACITELDDAISNVALVGHNPGMEDLANYLADTDVGAMPTCCVIQLAVECEHWPGINQGMAGVSIQLRPREL